MSQPYGWYPPNPMMHPAQVHEVLRRLSPVMSAVTEAGVHTESPDALLAGGILGSYLVSAGYPTQQAAEWAKTLLNAGTSSEEPVAEMPPALPAHAIVQSAEAHDSTLRTLIESSINDEATASRFYKEIADGLQSMGLVKAAEWVRGASRDETKHQTMLQHRYQQLYGRTPQPQVVPMKVEDMRAALTEALGDEFKDAVKYRDAYLRYPDKEDQRLFFELATDEMRHSTLFTYVLGLMK